MQHTCYIYMLDWIFTFEQWISWYELGRYEFFIVVGSLPGYSWEPLQVEDQLKWSDAEISVDILSNLVCSSVSGWFLQMGILEYSKSSPNIDLCSTWFTEVLWEIEQLKRCLDCQLKNIKVELDQTVETQCPYYVHTLCPDILFQVSQSFLESRQIFLRGCSEILELHFANKSLKFGSRLDMGRVEGNTSSTL